jgi:hypothetical protein
MLPAFPHAPLRCGRTQDWPETASGFGALSISTNPAFNDTAQMFAAGYLEGALTQPRIKQQVRVGHCVSTTHE